MTIKFTKTGVGAENGIETLLFEFQNHESPKELPLKYVTELATQKYVGSLQTNQLQGAYLQPISWEGQFKGNSLNYDNQIITAKERADELGRLQGRVLKFWYEGIKQLVIISEYETIYAGYNKVKYKITLQPHDIQIAINPSDQDKQIQNSLILIGDDLNANKPNPSTSNGGWTSSELKATVTVGKTIDQLKKDLAITENEIKDVSASLKDAQNKVRIFSSKSAKNTVGTEIDLAEARADVELFSEQLDTLNKSKQMIIDDINLKSKSTYSPPVRSDGVANKQRYTQ